MRKISKTKNNILYGSSEGKEGQSGCQDSLLFVFLYRHGSQHMKKFILYFVLSIFLFGFIRFGLNNRQDREDIEIRKSRSPGCSPGYIGNPEAGEDGKF